MRKTRNKPLPPRDAHAPLAGVTAIVTRPAGTGGALLRGVRVRGGRAISLPGLSLRALLPAPPPRRFDDWIFTSPAAVRFGAGAIARVRKRDRIFAIGSGTARALARHGLRAIIPRDRTDSEGLLALAELAEVRGRRIALVSAAGGRNLIAPTLRRRGAAVEAIHVYRRSAPRLTRRHIAALDAAPDPIAMLVSSADALTHLLAALPAAQVSRLRAQIIVVSSARLVALARENAFGEIVLARSAAPRDLIAAAAGALSRHRL